jgi:hypothetical protein
MQDGLLLPEYGSLESRSNLQEIHSSMDTDAADAAGLHWPQTHTFIHMSPWACENQVDRNNFTV